MGVEDEIYAYGLERNFTDVKHSASRATPRIYVKPGIAQNQSGAIIYRLMPFGEVFRLFQIRADGEVILLSNPEKGFGPTQPNVQTHFLDEDALMRMKETWIKTMFTVELQPSAERVEEAKKHQAVRFVHPALSRKSKQK